MSEAERFALPGISVGMRCNIAQYKLLRPYLDGKQKPHWKELHDELIALDKDDAAKEGRRAAIWLQGADLHEAHLEGVNLNSAHLEGAYLRLAHLEGADLTDTRLEGAVLGGAHLEGAKLIWASLKDADLSKAHLDGAELQEADLERAHLVHAHLEGAGLFQAHFGRAKLWDAHLEGADLNEARLRGADLNEAHLEGAHLRYIRLEGATFWHAHLERADFSFAVVDGETLFAECTVDPETDFTGVGLGACRIDPGLKQTLEYNIRRKRWKQWYADGPKWQWPLRQLVRPFWWMSDYGRSTGRIALWFIALSLVFAAVYFLCGLASPPGIVEGLFDYERGGQIVQINDPALIPLRAVYFSVVTMTTLGFGDINAQPLSYAGHLLLMLQVILGYVLLGALVCRLAILFQAGGPAAKFAKPPKPKPQPPGEADE